MACPRSDRSLMSHGGDFKAEVTDPGRSFYTRRQENRTNLLKKPLAPTILQHG